MQFKIVTLRLCSSESLTTVEVVTADLASPQLQNTIHPVCGFAAAAATIASTDEAHIAVS